MKNKEIYVSNLHVGQVFESFSSLYHTVTGKKFGSGSRNKKFAEKQFKRYFKYAHLNEIDPNEGSKQKLIILEIYDTPLEYKENRGKHGAYSDYLRPLILITPSFNGKIHNFYNRIGVMNKYIQYLSDNSNVLKQLNSLPEHEYNPWKVSGDDNSAVGEYKRHLLHQMRYILTSSLDALSNKSLLTWAKEYKILPFSTISVEDSIYSRDKSPIELEEERYKREKFWESIEDDENLTLDFELLSSLNINTHFWNGSMSRSDYLIFLRLEKGKDQPLQATSQQEEAIRQLEVFMRQLTIKEHRKMDHLPPVDELPNGFDFFDNSGLRNIHHRITREYYPWLVGCRSIWTEVRYEVIGSDEEINEYLGYDLKSVDKQALAEELSVALVQYMDGHMNKFDYKPEAAFGAFPDFVSRPLNTDNHARKFHNTIKSLYSV